MEPIPATKAGLAGSVGVPCMLHSGIMAFTRVFDPV
jgi:hypothetical protein